MAFRPQPTTRQVWALFQPKFPLTDSLRLHQFISGTVKISAVVAVAVADAETKTKGKIW
jgi:hypothetical protein